MELTDQEIDLLIKGLDSIEKSESTSDAMVGLMSSLFTMGKPDARAQMEQEMESAKRKGQAERRATADRCALMKARLITYRLQRNQTDFGEPENVKTRSA